MDRQAQFRAREALIFDVAERLLLESGEMGMTLDALALELDLAKGTLYKHFQSKDELYLLLIIRNEQALLDMVRDNQGDFQARLVFYMLHHLHHPERTVLFHQIEERLSAGAQGLGILFNQLYRIRKQRLRLIIGITDNYLKGINSSMPVRDYLAAIWSITQGAASMLNSSFYQRYLGSRDTFRVAVIDQMLAMPQQFKQVKTS
ncbi:TetR family transcriptional regulator [Alkanindiges hydrocarboniclasticus]|jgi:AcrR family transcriptional regulator|uniref:TetR family transcriptional regulator n=1 Tax=Alkanindiges hydrocarboniclasticus TaxID=1907941 RepID=A0A1S8CUW1_9GAMM|nr:TetR/AcrR family transcriptional regulator [Alkanindiges hydrocarboniclasticus]ONG38954.1 TetR family transcriptional regulator [Alkanindiges hydrocarboniclasticus]